MSNDLNDVAAFRGAKLFWDLGAGGVRGVLLHLLLLQGAHLPRPLHKVYFIKGEGGSSHLVTLETGCVSLLYLCTLLLLHSSTLRHYKMRMGVAGSERNPNFHNPNIG